MAKGLGKGINAFFHHVDTNQEEEQYKKFN